MVAGNSWIEAVFSTTSTHNSSLAVPPHPAAIRRAARIPRGVAALPSPSKLAETLAETAASVSPSRLASGSSRRSRGRKTFARAPDMPQASITSITPDQRQSTPAMARPSSTADPAPSIAAEATASRFPVAIPNTRDSATIPVHTQDMAIFSSFLS